MNILLNGENHTVDTGITVQSLLDSLQLNGRLAVEVNREIIPRSQHASHRLQESDKVEIVHAIGGG